MKNDNKDLKIELLFSSILKWTLIAALIGFVYTITTSDSNKNDVTVKQASVKK
jgi:hypothetical protein